MTQLFERFCALTLKEPYIYAHLPTLARLANECESIAETGTDIGASTTAFILGLANRLGKGTLYSIDIAQQEHITGDLEEIARSVHVRAMFLQGDARSTFTPDEVDFLFIDDRHEGGHLTEVLAAHAHKAGKYIGFHDTDSPWSWQGEGGGQGIVPAIQSFLAENPCWKIHLHHAHCNGLLILKKEES
jgi:hypothetical protein